SRRGPRTRAALRRKPAPHRPPSSSTRPWLRPPAKLRGSERQPPEPGFEQDEAIVAAEHLLAGALRVRHEAHHVTGRVADTGDVVHRAIAVGLGGDLTGGRGVAEDHLPLGLEAIEHVGPGEVLTLAM